MLRRTFLSLLSLVALPWKQIASVREPTTIAGPPRGGYCVITGIADDGFERNDSNLFVTANGKIVSIPRHCEVTRAEDGRVLFTSRIKTTVKVLV